MTLLTSLRETIARTASQSGFWRGETVGDSMPGVIAVPHGWGHDLPPELFDTFAHTFATTASRALS